jgi:hypothetical protein
VKYGVANLVVIIGLLFSLTSFARSVDPVNISAENMALIKAINQQCDKNTISESQACFKKLNDSYVLEGKFRGTSRYAETHYKKLAEKALYAKLDELKQLRKKARDLSDAMMDRVEGELTDDNYDAEIHWIVGELKLRGLSVPR